MTPDSLADQAAKMLAAVDFAARLESERERHSAELRRLLLGVLDVRDGLERILTVAQEGAQGRDGGAAQDAGTLASVRALARQLDDVLARSGVRPTEDLGRPFDPLRQEAVATRSAAGQAEDSVIEVLTRGYTLNDELVRRPRVVVARNRHADETT